jgi:hypothetical protein
LVIEALDAEEALSKAEKISLDEWSQDWAPFEIDDNGP